MAVCRRGWPGVERLCGAAAPADTGWIGRWIWWRIGRRSGRRPGPSLGGCPMLPANNAWNQNVSTLAVRSDSPDADREHQLVGQDEPPPRLRWRGRVRHPVQGRARDPAQGADHYTAYGDESDPGPFPIPGNAPVEGGSASTATGTCSWCSRGRVICTSSGTRSGRAIAGTPTSA